MALKPPPNTRQFTDWRDWADRYYRHITSDNQRPQPQVIQLAHRLPGQALSAAEDGILLYDAATQSIVLSVNGSFTTVSGGGGSLPAGGTTGQVLTKQSTTDGDAAWEDIVLDGGGA